MKARTASRLAWLAFGLTVVLYAGALLLSLLNGMTDAAAVAGRDASSIGSILFHSALLSFAVVGVLVASRQPRNTISRIFLAIGLTWQLWWFGATYLEYAIVTDPGSLPAPDVVAALTNWLWAPAVGLMGTFLILLFPDGRLPSPRWRVLAWLSALAIGLSSVADLFLPHSFTNIGFPNTRNPLGIEPLRPVLTVMGFAVALIPPCMIGCAVSLVQRFRRSRGVERLQLKWLASAAAAVAASYVVFWAVVIPFVSDPTPPLWAQLIREAASLSFALIPVAAGFAILKHRLYDIDVVINKTVVFGALAAFITAVYVAIVVGIGTLIGSGDRPNLGLSILATAIVAVAFQPVRERVQHFANRLVYGKRATPYEVLSEFSDRVAETYASDQVLPKMAKAIKDGTGAARAEVWLRSHDELRPAATCPEDTGSGLHPLPLSDGRLPSFESADKAIEVRHQGELLGALTVTKPAGEPLTPAEDKLLSDLASQAGLVLRNVGLTAELLQRLEELKASRQRLVAAQDEERRRLERNLHDGAQQHLVALKTRLSLAKRMTERDPAKAQDLIARLEHEADEALETLRDLARGIYPPLLADQGLKAALEAHARKISIPVEVTADDITRYPQEVEAAVYFCMLEALQNVGKYAQATHVTVRLQNEDDSLLFEVEDNGSGFDQTSVKPGSGLTNMRDRIEALGGTLSIRSAPGQGTRVTGSLPAVVTVPDRELEAVR